MLAGNKMLGQHKTDIKNCLQVLNEAVSNGETFFIKVHAAENLIYHKHTSGLEVQFLQLQKAAPENFIGSARVLARLNKQYPQKFHRYIKQLENEFTSGAGIKTRLTALESLGKLGYKTPSPQIINYADTGTGGFKAMARWVLSNNKSLALENRLSELLLSNEINDYRYAAYALRFKSKISAQTMKRLNECLLRLKQDDAARVYVASCLFVHDSAKERPRSKALLLKYADGEIGQQYEVAEGLGIRGTAMDIPVLKKLLANENTDVRVAAANALLKIFLYKR
ncbi:MAG: hypothetical protein JWR72_3515 [Flavisolibacter sp.]|nr:hypothetical protein [Flavisolibacter sp.]